MSIFHSWASEWQLYGRLPTFDCDECGNAISATRCGTCGHRITAERRSEIIKDADNKAGEKLPCHVCGVLITREELDENAAYTADGQPHCPAHYPNE